jgi:hypothetical protein
MARDNPVTIPLGCGPFGASEFFHFALEGFPINAVLLLFGPYLGILRLAQTRQIGRDGEREEWACGYHRGGFAREADGGVEESFLGARLPKPEFDALRFWLFGMRLIMALHQGTDHGPILEALGFLRIDEVGDGEKVKRPSIRDRCAPLPKHAKIRQVAKFCHDIDAEPFDTSYLTAVVDGVPAIQNARV